MALCEKILFEKVVWAYFNLKHLGLMWPSIPQLWHMGTKLDLTWLDIPLGLLSLGTIGDALANVVLELEEVDDSSI